LLTSLLCFLEQKHEATVSGAENKEFLYKEKEPFEKHLYKFMREKKTPIKRCPSLGFKEGQHDFTSRFSILVGSNFRRLMSLNYSYNNYSN